MRQRLMTIVPLFAALDRYDRQSFAGDLTAGITVAVMLIPQGMAYAMLAGLPPIVGLYAATLPVAVYALFGTSRQLAVGPVAMVSLMVAASVGALAPAGSESYWLYAILLAAMVGLIQLGMGLLRLGFVVNWLSHPVVSGFTSAAAIIIGLSQLKHLLGVAIPRSQYIHEILINSAQQLDAVHGTTLGIGIASILLLVVFKRWWPTFPAALVVVAIMTSLAYFLRLDDVGVDLVGAVPAGLPGWHLPLIELNSIWQLAPTAIAIALVGFMESISVAKVFARQNRYEVDANRELVGLGLSNIVGSLIGSYPVTGGFSRTAVNAQAGAKSGVSSLLTAGFIALTLLLFTDLFTFLPKAVLAAVIMVAVVGLIDIKEVRHLYRVKKGDLVLLIITFFATLGFGIEPGILIGVGASLLAVIYRISHPHVAILGRLPGGQHYRCLDRFPEAEQTPGVLALRIDAQFYFGNVSFLRETLAALAGQAKDPVFAIVIEAASMNQLDSSADAALRDLIREYREGGIEIYLANVRSPVLEVMSRSGLAALLGHSHFALSVGEAVHIAVDQHRAAPEPHSHRQLAR